MKISRLDGVDSWDNTDNSVTSQRNDTRHKSIGLGELSSKFDEFLAGRSQFDREPIFGLTQEWFLESCPSLGLVIIR